MADRLLYLFSSWSCEVLNMELESSFVESNSFLGSVKQRLNGLNIYVAVLSITYTQAYSSMKYREMVFSMPRGLLSLRQGTF